MDFAFTAKGNPGGVFVNESNPLVRVFGLGWGALLFVNLLGFFLYLLADWHHYYHYQPQQIACESWRAYVGLLLYDDPHFHLFGFRRVKNWSAYWDAAAFCLLVTFPVSRVIIVGEWALSLYRPDWFIRYCTLYPGGSYDNRLFWIGVGIAFLALIGWCILRYRENQSLSALKEAV